MVFRLPSQLESLVPPPYDQRLQPPPWRGSVFVSGMRSSDRSSSEGIFVTAVETDGEKAEQWPPAFHVRVLYDQPVLREFQAWIKAAIPPVPLCTFLPNRLRDTNLHAVNQTNFRSLSRVLLESQVIAVASWAPNTFPGEGMVIYPALNSSAVLVGALFFESHFPPFIADVSSPISPTSHPPLLLQAPQFTQYHPQRISNPTPFGSSYHRQSLSPHNSERHNSPIEQSISAHSRQQDPYLYIIQHAGPSGYNTGPSTSASDVQARTTIKNEEEGTYVAYPPSHQNPPYT